MKPDGPTMSTEEIARWEAALKQRVVAQREHREKYRGNPGNPMTIRGERRIHKKKQPCQQGELKCPHRWKIPECNGSEWLTAVCFYCGATKQQRAYWDETPVKPGSWRK